MCSNLSLWQKVAALQPLHVSLLNLEVSSVLTDFFSHCECFIMLYLTPNFLLTCTLPILIWSRRYKFESLKKCLFFSGSKCYKIGVLYFLSSVFYFMYMSVCMYTILVSQPSEKAIRSSEWLWATIRVLGARLRFSARATGALLNLSHLFNP